MNNDAIEKVGLGVDLLGGPEALTTLRAIRAEMTAIASLSGRGGGRGSDPATNVAGDISTREKLHAQANKRIAEDRIRAERRVSQEEIDIMAKAANRQIALKQQVAARAKQLREEERREQQRLLAEQAAAQQRALAQRRDRIRAYSQLPDIADRDLGSQRRAFRRYRNDEARDRNNPNDQTNIYRRQLAEEIQGQRLAIRNQRANLEDQRRLQEQALVNKQNYFRRDTEIQKQAFREQQELYRQAGPTRSTYNDIQRKLYQNPREYYNSINPRGPVEPFKFQTRQPQRTFDEYPNRAKNFARQFAANPNIRYDSVMSDPRFDEDIKGAYRQFMLDNNLIAERRKQELEAIRDRANTNKVNKEYNANQTRRQALQFGDVGNTPPLRGPNSGGGGNPPNQPPRGPRTPERFGGRNNPDELFNSGGFFTSLDAVGRITRNILLYEVVSRASYGLTQYIANSITAAKTTVEYANALRFATETAGGNVEQNIRLADSLGSIGLSRQQGRAAVTEAVRFAENRPEDTGRLVSIVSNIAAERGGGIDRTDELIEQLRRRESKFYKRIFGRTVESIYEEEAARVIDSRTTNPADDPNLYIGLKPNEFRTRKQEIAEYVAQMNDAAKEQSVFNYILSQESKFAGEAAERSNTLAGRLDKLSASLLNGQEGLGLFLTDLKLFSNIADNLTGKIGFLDRLRPPELGRTGQQGTVSEYDLQRYGLEATTGPRRRALDTIDNLAGPVALTALSAGALALVGNRQANISLQQKAYNDVLKTASTKFGGDLSAATNEAIYQAQQTRAGLVTKIGTGLNRVTTNLSATVFDTLGRISQVTSNDRITANLYRQANTLRGDIGVVGPSSLSQAYRDNLARYGTGGGVAGGITGGVIGAGIASFIADKITSNQIIATGITILGGAAGTAAGTFLGNAAGSALGGAVTSAGGFGAFLRTAGAGGIGALSGTAGISTLGAGALTAGVAGVGLLSGYGIGTLIEPIISDILGLPAKQVREDDRKFKQEVASFSRYSLAVRERLSLQQDNRIRFRSKTGSSNLVTGAELARSGNAIGDGRGGFENYTQVILPPLSEKQKVIEDILKQRDRQITELLENPGLTEVDRQKRIDRVNSDSEQTLFDARNPEAANYRAEYRARQAASIDARLQKDRQEADEARNRRIQEMSNALSKLREAEQGSFRLVGDIATSKVGDDNPYVKVLSEQITIAERMRQQWGFLGDAAVDYFTKLEQGAARRQLNKLEFGSYTTASNLIGQSEREIAERNGPGFSRREQDYLDIQQAIVDRAILIPTLWKQAAEVLGQDNLSTQQVLSGRLNLIADAFGVTGPRSFNVFGQDITQRLNRFNAFGQSLGDLFDVQGRRNAFGQSLTDPRVAQAFTSIGVGESPEVRNALQKSFADAIVDTFKDYTPQQIRQSGYKDYFVAALGVQGLNAERKIQERQQKALIGIREDARLEAQLRADEQFRQAQISKGYDPRDVGRESDALLLARTDGIASKDLTLTQFTARQDALRRNAERQEQDRQEAQKAVQEGLRYQQEMNANIAAIRAAILGGDVSMLVQVQNDTQARIDQQDLQELASGQYNVPLDQNGVESNPYSGSLTRYKRGGRK